MKLKQSDKIYDLREIDATAKEENSIIYYKSRWIKVKGLEQQLIATFSPKYKE